MCEFAPSRKMRDAGNAVAGRAYEAIARITDEERAQVGVWWTLVAMSPRASLPHDGSPASQVEALMERFRADMSGLASEGGAAADRIGRDMCKRLADEVIQVANQ
jgi:hypothetical protein